MDNDEFSAMSLFVPTKFVFVNFYDKEACIVWNTQTLIILDYPLPENLTNGTILTPPGPIKDIKILRDKIYVLCSPSGIWKLSKDNSFAKVSSSGIGIGTTLYLTFSPTNNILYCSNKYLKTTKPLFSILGDVEDIKFFHLFHDTTDEDLLETLVADKSVDSCLISNQKNLLLFCKDEIKIVYNCNTVIKDITAFDKGGKTFGIVLLTDAHKLVFIYPRKKELKIENIHLESQVEAFCAGVCTFNENKVWMIYSDGEKTYHLFKNLDNDDAVITLSVLEKVFLWLSLYKSQKLSGLTKNESDSVCFLQVPIEDLEMIESDSGDSDRDTVDLKPDMLEQTDTMMDLITDKIMELNVICKDLEAQRDLVKRINMYTIKWRVECIPKLKVFCLSHMRVLMINFLKHLPQNSQIVVSLKLDSGPIFAVKRVSDSETVVELAVPNEKIKYPIDLKFHLVVLNEVKGAWCLINNFVKDPPIRQDAKHPLTIEKLNFLNNKRMMLRKLMDEKKVDWKTLSEIKKSIRREIPEV